MPQNPKDVLKRVRWGGHGREDSGGLAVSNVSTGKEGGESGVLPDTKNKPKSVSFVINDEIEPHFKTLATLLRFFFGNGGDVTLTDDDLLRADKWARCISNDDCRSISQCEIPTAASTCRLKIGIIVTIQKHFVDHQTTPPREELSKLKDFLDSKYDEFTGIKQQRELRQTLMRREEDRRRRRRLPPPDSRH